MNRSLIIFLLVVAPLTFIDMASGPSMGGFAIGVLVYAGLEVLLRLNDRLRRRGVKVPAKNCGYEFVTDIPRISQVGIRDIGIFSPDDRS